ncbi:MAG: DUF1761 domain-containing protein [Actinomycetota bacterium]|nr:DUF1761 domain-containing protein [Actinomycetota bacterium]
MSSTWMSDLNFLTILLATGVVIVISGVHYGVLGTRLARLSLAYAGSAPSAAATLAVELVRSLVVAIAVATLVAGLSLDDLTEALLLALGLWVAFPIVLLTGAVFHERVPPLLAAIHSGDWLLKLVAIAAIVGLRQ